jgi:putative ABC transport system ATP-binding protein
MPVLQAHNIRKDFPEGGQTLTVLRGVSLHLEQGEIVSLEGPSGSGKTTLLSILGCIMSPTSGHVIVEDQTIDRDDPALLQSVRKRSIGFVFQQFNLIPSLTALENVEYALNIKGLKGRAAKDEATRAMTSVGLVAKLHAMPRDLSGGQKQRVAVARALAGRSPILLVDEPTANLDAQSAEQVLHLFRRLARAENRAVLVVTHDPKVRTVVDRVLTIREGQLREQLDMHAPSPTPVPESASTPAPAPSPGTPGEGRGEGPFRTPEAPATPLPRRRNLDPFSMT